MNIQACLIKLGYNADASSNSYDEIVPDEFETRPIPSLTELEAVWPEIEADSVKIPVS